MGVKDEISPFNTLPRVRKEGSMGLEFAETYVTKILNRIEWTIIVLSFVTDSAICNLGSKVLKKLYFILYGLMQLAVRSSNPINWFVC